MTLSRLRLPARLCSDATSAQEQGAARAVHRTQHGKQTVGRTERTGSPGLFLCPPPPPLLLAKKSNRNLQIRPRCAASH